MRKKSVVLPSTRSIRNRVLLEHTDGFLCNYMTMSELLAKALYLENRRFADADTRTVLLLEAANFENFKTLQIDRNFFTFTKNASFIFDFYEELSQEQVDIEAIEAHDVYGEYEEHLRILKELKERYRQLCEAKGLSDKIFIPQNYQLNTGYLRRAEIIELHVEGMLTNFEITLLDAIAKECALFVHITTSPFNKKMQKKLSTLGFELEESYSYRLEWKSRSILEAKPLNHTPKITLQSVSQRVLQVAAVKRAIYEYVKKGYDPQKIAVIVPDESFVELLELFDRKNNLNFAMGKSFEHTFVYKKLRATLDALDLMSVMHEAALERVGDDLYSRLFPIYKKELAAVDCESLLQSFLEYATTTAQRELLEKEIEKFLKLLPYLSDLSLKAALHLFVNRIGALSLDDVGGGKITVMGVLETRGVEFDAVVIVDFNENIVPKRLEKDMFLNSAIRKHAGLPTQADREELQKHYYHTLMQRCKEVTLCYVENQTQMPSRFLKELAIEQKANSDESALADILFDRSLPAKEQKREIVAEYDFTKGRLSSSKLETFLSCKRKFYYKYIAHIDDFVIPSDIPQEWEIAKHLHEALKNLYSNKSSYEDAASLHKDLLYELSQSIGENELHRFQLSLYGTLLQEFCNNEVKRFAQGVRVVAVEKEMLRQVGNITLFGVIDRIDQTAEGYEVLDYKSGTIKLYSQKQLQEAGDFQLEIYYLLANTPQHKVSSVGFYDLKKGRIIQEAFFEEKMELLLQHLQNLEKTKSFEAAMCDDLQRCSRCEYKIMCGRA